MEKVKLNQKQADALEYVISKNNGREIIIAHANDPEGWLGEAAPLKSLDFDTLVKALYYGYEIELTPEEKLDELYKEYENKYLLSLDATTKSYYIGICHGITIAKENLMKQKQ